MSDKPIVVRQSSLRTFLMRTVCMPIFYIGWMERERRETELKEAAARRKARAASENK